MKRFVVFACAALMSVCAGLPPLHAQEAVAADPTSGAVGLRLDAYERKIQDLTRLIKIMEEQLNKCAAQQGVICPSVLAAAEKDNATTHRNTTFSAAEESAPDEVSEDETVTNDIAPPPPAYTPPAPTRYGSGFRMAPEQRLTCADYSSAYFERHPTMAKVCGRGEAAATPDVPARAPVAPAPAVSGTSAL